MTATSATRGVVELLVVGAGPTGIAIGAEARRAGVGVLLVDRGPLTAALLGFPTYMTFFTTRDRLEIADIPFAIPEEKPDRRQALAYYRAVAARYGLPLRLHEEVLDVRREGEEFAVRTRGRRGEEGSLRAVAVALATGYFGQPRRLGAPGEDLPWVRHRYLEPYGHFDEDILVVGGGNSAAEAALDLWRAGARVTLVHRGQGVKPTVKYWLKPDLENRIAEGSIAARFLTVVEAFRPDGAEIEGPAGREVLPCAAAYLLLGYLPDVELGRRCGIRYDPETLVPEFDPSTCESNVPGLYVAGTLQAGRDTGRIFIENSRDHGALIVRHLQGRLRRLARTGA
jgi:thioredoxin reductase (NADPH)